MKKRVFALAMAAVMGLSMSATVFAEAEDVYKRQSLKSVETMYLSRAKAADYGVEFTEEDKKAVDEAAAEFVKANSEETMAELAATEEDVYKRQQMYMANMKSIFMDMVRGADMVVFNRCKASDPLATYRRGIKVANQRAEIIFEDEEGEIDNIFQDEMPFDVNAPLIDILPEDYGIWFVDAMDHPDTYVGKTVRFKGRALKPRGMGSRFFVPGRMAMTCCADDTTFLGYVCKSDDTPRIHEGQWVEVTARVAFEQRMEYQGEGIVLYADLSLIHI